MPPIKQQLLQIGAPQKKRRHRGLAKTIAWRRLLCSLACDGGDETPRGGSQPRSSEYLAAVRVPRPRLLCLFTSRSAGSEVSGARCSSNRQSPATHRPLRCANARGSVTSIMPASSRLKPHPVPSSWLWITTYIRVSSPSPLPLPLLAGLIVCVLACLLASLFACLFKARHPC